MKIRILYTFYTDGDYSLKDPDNFSCTGREVTIEDEYFDYIGNRDFENEEVWRCKNDAKNFLTQLLCDGLHISYTHHWLVEDFYNIIESLIELINSNDSGELCKKLTRNYDGTMIGVEFL